MLSKRITEWGSVLSGKTSGHYLNRHYSATHEDYKIWVNTLHMSPTGKSVLDGTEDSQNFFNIEKDLALLIPDEQKTECFYALKNGFAVPNCPSKFIYFANKIFDLYQIGNIIAPMLPNPIGKELSCSNYFGVGYTGTDVIRNFVHQGFQPITSTNLIVSCGDWYEAYAPMLNKVVVVPNDIGKHIKSDDMEYMDFDTECGLVLGSTPISTFGSNLEWRSVYDLRKPVQERHRRLCK